MTLIERITNSVDAKWVTFTVNLNKPCSGVNKCIKKKKGDTREEGSGGILVLLVVIGAVVVVAVGGGGGDRGDGWW
jgi:hypothetical protein